MWEADEVVIVAAAAADLRGQIDMLEVRMMGILDGQESVARQIGAGASVAGAGRGWDGVMDRELMEWVGKTFVSAKAMSIEDICSNQLVFAALGDGRRAVLEGRVESYREVLAHAADCFNRVADAEFQWHCANGSDLRCSAGDWDRVRTECRPVVFRVDGSEVRFAVLDMLPRVRHITEMQKFLRVQLGIELIDMAGVIGNLPQVVMERMKGLVMARWN
jgi:hypothetical protein